MSVQRIRSALRYTAALFLLWTGFAEASARSAEQVLQKLTRATDTCEHLRGRMVSYDVVFRRDPMRPLIDAQGQVVSSAGLHSGLAVQGVMLSAVHPMVVVEDELLGQGDQIGPYRILEIRSDGVVVQQSDERLVFIPLDRGVDVSREPSVEFPNQ